MSLFVASISDIQSPGVFPIEVAPPLIVEGVANGYIGYAFQAPWGDVKTAVLPAGASDLLARYFPAGAPHTGTGYIGMARRKKFNAVMCRVLGGAAGLLPPIITLITNLSAPGSTTVTYQVVAKNASGATVGSQVAIITTSNATLNNKIDWAAVTGATGYDVYRISGGATQGKIATSVAVLTYTDAATAASGAIPTANTTGYAQAVAYILDSAGVCVARIVALYPGTLPNGALTAQVAAASDGDANHFDLILTLQDAVTGSTTEKFPNLDSRTSTAIAPDVTTSRLMASFSLVNTSTTRALNGTYAFVNGSDGAAVVASDYNDALTQFGLRDDIAVVVTDDCGDTIRAAVNDDVQAHVEAKTDRIGIVQGAPGNAWATVVTDVANYRGDRMLYMGAWVSILDDAGTTVQRTPFATFVASAIVNLEPQQSHAWWDNRVTEFYQGVNSILAPQFSTADDSVQKQATSGGICLPIRLGSGRYAALHDRTTSTTLQRRFMVTRRIKDYLAKSIKNALTSFVNGPNLPSQWEIIKLGLDPFFANEVAKGRLIATDPVDVTSSNNTSTQVAGQFIFTCTAKSPTVMESIIPLINVGPGVVGVSFQ